MIETKLFTEFLPAEKSSIEELYKQHEYFSNQEMLKSFMNSMPASVIMLNKNRQIICANKYFMKLSGKNSISEIIGLRPGDVFNCDHAAKSLSGCGTTKFCTVCGAAKAIFESQQNISSIHECLLTREDADALDLQVWANPFIYNDEFFTIFAIIDKSDEKRRANLERIFFHDILNTAGGIKGYVELMHDSDSEELKEYITVTYDLSERLIEEIESQRELIRAEKNELVISSKPFSTYDMLKEIRTLYLSHCVARNKKILIDENCLDTIMSSDKSILRRVLGNLVKNALEVISEHESIRLNCFLNEDKIVFSVHNSTFIPEVLQLQIFKRSFSTKGLGRGLGTYSVRLFTEKYLNGTVDFTSDQNSGTTFFVSYPRELKTEREFN